MAEAGCEIKLYKDKEDLENILKANKDLIYKTAKKFQYLYNHSLPLEDLVSAATIGFIKAYKRILKNPKLKAKSYIYSMMKVEILNNICVSGFTLTYRINVLRDLKIYTDLKKEYKCSPLKIKLESLLKKYGVDKKFLKKSKKIIYSLKESKSYDLIDFRYEKIYVSNYSLEEEAYLNMLIGKIESLLSLLPLREQEIFQARYALSNKDMKTLSELALEYKLSVERIRQIQMEVLDYLKKSTVIEKYKA